MGSDRTSVAFIRAVSPNYTKPNGSIGSNNTTTALAHGGDASWRKQTSRISTLLERLALEPAASSLVAIGTNPFTAAQISAVYPACTVSHTPHQFNTYQIAMTLSIPCRAGQPQREAHAAGV